MEERLKFGEIQRSTDSGEKHKAESEEVRVLLDGFSSLVGGQDKGCTDVQELG